MADFIYAPKKSLDVPMILEYCRRNGLQFQYSNEIINVVWENLNLVVHFGFQLSSEVLWYMFWIAKDTHLVAEGDENSARQQVRQVLENLTAAKHVEKLDVHTLRNEGLTIVSVHLVEVRNSCQVIPMSRTHMCPLKLLP